MDTYFHVVNLAMNPPTVLLDRNKEPFEFHSAESAQGAVYYLNDLNHEDNWIWRPNARYFLREVNGFWRSTGPIKK